MKIGPAIISGLAAPGPQCVRRRRSRDAGHNDQSQIRQRPVRDAARHPVNRRSRRDEYALRCLFAYCSNSCAPRTGSPSAVGNRITRHQPAIIPDQPDGRFRSERRDLPTCSTDVGRQIRRHHAWQISRHASIRRAMPKKRRLFGAPSKGVRQPLGLPPAKSLEAVVVGNTCPLMIAAGSDLPARCAS